MVATLQILAPNFQDPASLDSHHPCRGFLLPVCEFSLPDPRPGAQTGRPPRRDGERVVKIHFVLKNKSTLKQKSAFFRAALEKSLRSVTPCRLRVRSFSSPNPPNQSISIPNNNFQDSLPTPPRHSGVCVCVKGPDKSLEQFRPATPLNVCE